MANKQRKESCAELELRIKRQLDECKIKYVADGYKSAMLMILQMMNENTSNEDIKNYCNWILKNNEKIIQTAIDNAKIPKNQNKLT